MLMLVRGRDARRPQDGFLSAEELDILPDDHMMVDAEFLGRRQPPIEDHICMYCYNYGAWPDENWKQRQSGGDHG